MGESLLTIEHRYVPHPRRLPSAYDLAKVGFFLFGFPRNGFGAIDTTKECNLRCRHCYFFEFEDESRRTELEIDQWIEKLEDLRRTTSRREFPFFQCTWVGGEPLLRKELIERGRKYFRYNTVVTNGTIPLPDWPDVNWYISIDGDEATHEQIRRKKGIYRRAMRNVEEHPDLRVTIAMCITRGNLAAVEQVCRDWSEAGATHITFDFYTPMEGVDDPMWLAPLERDRAIDLLLDLKSVYRDFIVAPERTFRLMYARHSKTVTDDCPFAAKSFSFDPAGAPKEKCMMGANADCDRCGCVVPFYMWSLTDRRFVVEDLARELTHAAKRAASGVLTAVLG